MKNIMLAFITLFTSTLAGCSQVNEIQFQAYAVGLGIDYIDDEYKVFLQFLDFSNVAKSEQGKSPQKSSVWITSGSGKSIEAAFTKMYQGVQLPVNYDQLNVILFGKSLIEHKLGKTLQALDTNYNIRVTGLTYGTEKKLEDIFTSQVPFNYPFIYSRINEPSFMQQQDSTIPAISLQELIYQYNEKTKTIMLPNISLDNDTMKENTDKVTMSTFDGAYIIKDQTYKGILSEKELKGFIKVNNQTVRSLVTFKGAHDEETAIEILNPKIKRRVFTKNHTLAYGLNIKIRANIRESNHNIINLNVKKALADKLRTEVYQSYKNSQAIGGDVFQFEDYMYRYKNSDWKTCHHQGTFPTLKKEDIHIKISPLKSINKMNARVSRSPRNY